MTRNIVIVSQTIIMAKCSTVPEAIKVGGAGGGVVGGGVGGGASDSQTVTGRNQLDTHSSEIQADYP